MTKEELIEALADYFEVEIPDNIYRDYDWNSGCAMGDGRQWLTLANVVEAIERADLIER